jgi:hypothetical protein
MKKRVFAAVGLIWAVGTVAAWAQAPAQPVAAPRTPELVAADLQATDQAIKGLAKEEGDLIAGLKAGSTMPTNLLSAAGGDADLAAKIKKMQDLQVELNALKEDVKKQMADSPVLKERRAVLEKRRARLMEIQETRKTLADRRKALLEEQAALARKSAAGTAKPGS